MYSYKKSILAVFMTFSLVAAPAMHAAETKDIAVATGVVLSAYALSEVEDGAAVVSSSVGFFAGAICLKALENEGSPVPVLVMGSIWMLYSWFLKSLYANCVACGNQSKYDEAFRRVSKYELFGALMGIGAVAIFDK